MRKWLVLSMFIPLVMGTRVVGHGGGEGEMLALGAQSKLYLMIRPCMVEGNPCRLSLAERAYLQHITEHRLLGDDSLRLTFFSSADSSKPFKYDKNTVSLRAEELYDDHANVVDISQVLSLLFAGNLGRPALANLTAGQPDALELGRKLFKNSQSQMSLALWPATDRKVSAINVLKNGVNEFAILSVQDDHDIYDVTGDVKMKLSCDVGSPVLVAITNLGDEGKRMTSDVFWRCGENYFQGYLSFRDGRYSSEILADVRNKRSISICDIEAQTTFKGL